MDLQKPDDIRHNRRRTINSPNNGEWRMVNGEWKPPEVNSPLHRESVTNEESQKMKKKRGKTRAGLRMSKKSSTFAAVFRETSC
jgi:hypothetical protein